MYVCAQRGSAGCQVVMYLRVCGSNGAVTLEQFLMCPLLQHFTVTAVITANILAKHILAVCVQTEIEPLQNQFLLRKIKIIIVRNMFSVSACAMRLLVT